MVHYIYILKRRKRLRLGRDWLRMLPPCRIHVGDMRSVGLPSRWKWELILFLFFLICCQFCHLYSNDCIITFCTNHPTMSRPTHETFCFLFMGFSNPTVSPYLCDGVLLNSRSQYSLYRSGRHFEGTSLALMYLPTVLWLHYNICLYLKLEPLCTHFIYFEYCMALWAGWGASIKGTTAFENTTLFS